MNPGDLLLYTSLGLALATVYMPSRHGEEYQRDLRVQKEGR